MDNIIEPTSAFDFGQLSLAYPSGIQGGAYFTKLLCRGKPTYIQTTKSLLKQGFTKSGKKWYCDLMFDSSAHELIQWMERLEEKCRELIIGKSADWFQGTLEASDVESSFGAIMRLYRSGKYYLLRANTKTDISGNPLVRFYGEDQSPLGVDDVKTDTYVVSILEVQGIKFTTRSFQLEFEVKQMMIVDKEPMFDNFMIKGFSRRGFEDAVVKNGSNELTVKSEAKSEPTINELNAILSEATNEMTVISEATNTNVKSEPTINAILSEATVKSEATNEILSEALNEMNISEPTAIAEHVKSEPTSEATVKSEAKSGTSTSDAKNEEINELSEPIIEIDAIDLDKDDDIKEIHDVSVNDALDAIQLRKPNQIYFDMYKLAREKAKSAKQSAISAYLEAKNIKNTYMLNDSDSESECDFNELEQL